MHRFRRIFIWVVVAILLTAGTFGLFSYRGMIGATFYTDGKGNYVGIRTARGSIGIFLSATVPSSAPRSEFGNFDWYLLFGGWKFEPRSFVNCEMTNLTGQPVSWTYSGSLNPPYREEYRQYIVGIHGALLQLSGFFGILFLLRRPLRQHMRRRNNQCELCSYDQRGNSSLTCPECGHVSQSIYGRADSSVNIGNGGAS